MTTIEKAGIVLGALLCLALGGVLVSVTPAAAAFAIGLLLRVLGSWNANRAVVNELEARHARELAELRGRAVR